MGTSKSKPNNNSLQIQIKQEPPKKIFIKVTTAFIGPQKSGKSSLINQFIQNKFDEDYKQTIGIDFMTKNLYFADQITTLRFLVWDTAGAERFSSLIPSYLRKKNSVVIVFSLNDDRSFLQIEHWITMAQKSMDKIPIFVLVGTKSDLERKVSFKQASNLAKRHGMMYGEVSGKDHTGIDELFSRISIFHLNHEALEQNHKT